MWRHSPTPAASRGGVSCAGMLGYEDHGRILRGWVQETFWNSLRGPWMWLSFLLTFRAASPGSAVACVRGLTRRNPVSKAMLPERLLLQMRAIASAGPDRCSHQALVGVLRAAGSAVESAVSPAVPAPDDLGVLTLLRGFLGARRSTRATPPPAQHKCASAEGLWAVPGVLPGAVRSGPARPPGPWRPGLH